MKTRSRNLIPFGIGILAALMLSGVYFAIVSWAESPQHAFELFWEDRWLVIPILLGFGIQAGLYSVYKLRLFVPSHFSSSKSTGIYNPATEASMGAGGTTSTVAMVACCAHHATDVLPIFGLTAAATFLAQYRTAFMVAGVATNLIGIGVILIVLVRARRKLDHSSVVQTFVTEKI